MISKIDFVDTVKQICKDDPVRPSIPAEWRVDKGRDVWLYTNKDQGPFFYRSACCVAFVNSIPISEMDMTHRVHTGNIAVAYTVWSKEKGAGRKILLDLQQKYKDNNNVKRFITLSPKTEMAMKFHLSNGATLLQENETTNNFEYSL